MKIKMQKETHDKIMYWIDKADFEVSGFGNVIWDQEKREFLITDAILLKQEGGAAHTDIDPLSLSKAQYELRNAEGDLRFWWHSHVNMAAFMSSTDKNTIQEISQQGWCVALVFNKRREFESAVGFVCNTPFGNVVEYKEKIPFEVLTPPKSDWQIAWERKLDEEYSAHVTEKTYTRASYYSQDWEEYDKTMANYRAEMGIKPPQQLALLSTKHNDDFLSPELVEEARILGIKPHKWFEMCQRKDLVELDTYFEFINLGLTAQEGFKALKVLKKQGYNHETALDMLAQTVKENGCNSQMRM